MVCPQIVSTDLDDLWLLCILGEAESTGTLVQVVINTYSISGRESRCLSHDLSHGFGGPVEWMGMLIPFLNELVDLCT